MQEVQSPFQIFLDADGSPLEAGKIYIGTAGLDAEANQVNAYWDEGLTIPAAQPITTLQGIPQNGANAGRIYVDGNYSIKVLDKTDALVLSNTDNPDRVGAAIGGIQAENIAFTPITGNAADDVQEAIENVQAGLSAVGDVTGLIPDPSASPLGLLRANAAGDSFESVPYKVATALSEDWSVALSVIDPGGGNTSGTVTFANDYDTCQIYLKNLSADAGYPVGTLIPVSDIQKTASDHLTLTLADGAGGKFSNAGYRWRRSAIVLHGTTGAQTVITPASWTFHVRGWTNSDPT